MGPNDNITQVWDGLKRQACQAWKNELREAIEPELDSRGITIDSASTTYRGEEFDYILFCSALSGDYIEIRVDCKKAFLIKVTNENEVYFWPDTPLSTYDRGNYTVQQLLDWLDTKSWKE